MAKSFNFGETFLDSSGVAHEKMPLNKILNDGLVEVCSTNPRDITKVWIRKSKNLFNSATETGGYDANGSKHTDSTMIRNATPIKVAPSTKYIMSNNGSGIAINILEYDSDYNFIKKTVYSAGTSFTTSSTTRYINCFKSATNFDKPQLESGSTITSYEAYVDKKIYVANDNGVFEEFINVEELTEPEITVITDYNSNFTTVDVNNVVKIGKVVTVTFRGYAETGIANSSELFKVPYKIAKAGSTIFFVGSHYACDSFVFAWWGDNGPRLLMGPVTAGKWVHIHLTYITNE